MADVEFRLPTGMVIYYHHRGHPVRDLLWMYNEIFRDACYLHNDFFKMDEITEVIFDCGANIGLFTLWAALRCPNATIYAFEPIPQIFYTMTRNIARYNFSNRVQAYNIGLGELPANGGAHDQEVDFRFYPELSSMSTCLWQKSTS
jgi:hypothetical protein